MRLAAGSGLSTLANASTAAEAACAEALGALGNGGVDVAFVFFSGHDDFAIEIAEVAHKVLGPAALLGCSAQAVVGGSREVEDTPAVSVWAARLPATSILTFGVEFDSATGAFTGAPDLLPPGATVLMIADPLTFPVDRLLERFNDAHPGVNVIGGLASGALAPGAT